MSDVHPIRKNATRKDVARRAGVSDAVVSYTLNGGAPVAPATAKRVLEAVQALGYQPNQAAKALKSGSARTIALILPTGTGTNPFFTELAHVVETAARAEGYALYMTSLPSDDPHTFERFQEFAARQVDGVLVVPGDVPLDVERLDSVRMPWVTIAATSAQAGVASFGVDLRAGAVAAVEHLVSHGYDSIAFVGDIDDGESRHAAWRETCRAHGVEPGPAIRSPFTREGGYAAGRELIAAGAIPRSVFAASDMIAIGVLRALHEHGLRVPDDVAVASFDGSWESEYSWPALTTVRQPIELLADATLARLLGRDASPSTHSTFPGELIVRASCGRH